MGPFESLSRDGEEDEELRAFRTARLAVHSWKYDIVPGEGVEELNDCDCIVCNTQIGNTVPKCLKAACYSDSKPRVWETVHLSTCMHEGLYPAWYFVVQ